MKGYWMRVMERFISDWEYPTHFEDLGGLRRRIVKDLPIKVGMHILDVATGDGFFAIEIVKLYGDVKIVGIDISPIVLRKARRNIRRQNLQDIIEVLEMDATNMRFPNEEFEMAVDFTGLEDVQMTRGLIGVQEALFEVNRVLKPNCYFCIAEMISDEMETESQKLEMAVFSYICGRKALSSKDYRAMIKKARFKLIQERSYYSGLKFTPQQAKREIKHAIKNIPRIYGITTPSFKEVWAKFGKKIEEHGMGCYSKVALMITQKVQDIP
jgi:ubiquinone/menaquinone biosynthesis C-methylase UbiE